ncbi:MAG: hypothetical protein HC817_00420 [Saprospiraceae bacterium]|nr:hypothetical protein [Saprospiraceae bacterium]
MYGLTPNSNTAQCVTGRYRSLRVVFFTSIFVVSAKRLTLRINPLFN